MAVQTVFKRYELKYLLTLPQKRKVLQVMAPYMKLDKYGRASIRNIYYDTDTYLLVRRSIEKPAYKEKLRIRSYGRAEPGSTVFVELKKKHEHVVYKRRIAMPEKEAMQWLGREEASLTPTQIAQEVDYFLDHYGSLRPAAMICYEREAYYANDGSDFRVTFDDNIIFRQEEMSLETPVYGTSLLPEGMVLMEIKCSGGIPMWLTRLLSQEKIYKTSFSKYGTAYQQYIFPQMQGICALNHKEEKHHV